MSKIKTAALKEGMMFDAPVFMEGDSLFIPANVPIKQKEIDRLIRWEIHELETEGKPVAAGERPGAAAAPETSSQSKTWQVVQDKAVTQSYAAAVDVLDLIFDDLRANEGIEHDRVDDVVRDLIERVRDNRNDMVQAVLFSDTPGRKLAAGSVNSTVLSIVIGLQLNESGHHINQLATGAYLHDVGMLKVPAEIVDKQGALTPDEVNLIRAHPIHSYKMIGKVLRYPQEIAEIALHHHERWDGTGYPRRLKGGDILLNARILAVAESYAAMVKERPYRDSMIGYHAMKSILSDNGRRFDPGILKAFLASTGIFPIGSIVQLNNSAVGRIVSTHAEAPLRPRVELVIDEDGSRLAEPHTIDLVERKNLFIVKAIDPRTLEG